MDVIEYWKQKLNDKEAEVNQFSSYVVKEKIRKEIEEIKEIIKELEIEKNKK